MRHVFTYLRQCVALQVKNALRELRLKPVYNNMLREELIVIIFNCASANIPFVSVAIKPAICNCEGTRTRGGHEIPEINDTQRYAKSLDVAVRFASRKFSRWCTVTAKLSFLATSQERPSRFSLSGSPLLSPLLRLIDRDTDEETPNASERDRIVFNQAREKENWKALEKWSTPRSENRRW